MTGRGRSNSSDQPMQSRKAREFARPVFVRAERDVEHSVALEGDA